MYRVTEPTRSCTWPTAGIKLETVRAILVVLELWPLHVAGLDMDEIAGRGKVPQRMQHVHRLLALVWTDWVVVVVRLFLIEREGAIVTVR